MESGVGGSTTENTYVYPWGDRYTAAWGDSYTEEWVKTVNAEPKVMLEISNNAKTFGQPRERNIGQKGEYWKKCVWYRNGRSHKFKVLRFTCSEDVKFVPIRLEAHA